MTSEVSYCCYIDVRCALIATLYTRRLGDNSIEHSKIPGLAQEEAGCLRRTVAQSWLVGFVATAQNCIPLPT